ncbi:hypothetical protein BJ165DRAFT_853185 [Panaeolus papilionaceus]|nr:hypothetical protein BJ165DRAFT_853185 [Panaeolus papilionaceus]
MNGCSYLEIDKSSVNLSTGVNVRLKALPGRRAPVYMKDFFPGDEFECFVEEPSLTRQQDDGTYDREGIFNKHHSRKGSSKQSSDSIPIVSEDVQVVVPLRNAETASGSQYQRSGKRHGRRESKHENNSIPITSDEIPVEVPIAYPPPKPAGSSSSLKRQSADPSRSVGGEIYRHHPPPCSVKVCAIFRKSPLVLGVHLIDGVLREGMEFNLASPLHLHSTYGVGGIMCVFINPTLFT